MPAPASLTNATLFSSLIVAIRHSGVRYVSVENPLFTPSDMYVE
jgi:hypothetical protein